MNEKLMALKSNLHQISNKLLIVNKTFDIFAKQFPDHKLTAISLKALGEFNDLINNSKSILAKMIDLNEEANSLKNADENKPANNISEKFKMISKWYRGLHSRSEEIADMFPIKLNLRDREFHDIDLNEDLKTVLDEVLFNLLELFVNSQATEVDFDLLLLKENLTLSFTDNSQELLAQDAFEIASTKLIIQKINAQLQIKGIQGVGNQIQINF